MMSSTYTSTYIIEPFSCFINKEASAMEFVKPEDKRNLRSSLYHSLGIILDHITASRAYTHNEDGVHLGNLVVEQPKSHQKEFLAKKHC